MDSDFVLGLLRAVAGYRITDNSSGNKVCAQCLVIGGSIVVQTAVVEKDDLYPAVVFPLR